MGSRGGSELARGVIDVAGVRRSYRVASAPRRSGQAAPPLLIALHGAGMDGQAMARLTGLADRGPAAGITTVFPDGWKGCWHPARPPASQPDLDDARFLSELAAQLEGAGAARSWPVFLAGIAAGARYAEYVARHGLLPVAGLFLVAGTALEFGRRQAPVPQLRASMVLVIGTGDRTTPYAGGRLTRAGLPGMLQRHRAARHGELPDEDLVASAEDVLGDWAAANGVTPSAATASGFATSGVAGHGSADHGFSGYRTGGAGLSVTGSFTRPQIEELPTPPGDLPVTRKAWTRPGCHSATLYRIDGGGHGWPGGPQPPARAGAGCGPVSRQPDATGLLLDMAERETASALGYPALDRSGIA